jgi:membrane-associated phospholipid phosphatase
MSPLPWCGQILRVDWPILKPRLCWLATARTSSRAWRWRRGIIGIACTLVTLVGFSRMYLGARYLSDVLAAVTAGVAWLALCLTAVASILRRARF